MKGRSILSNNPRSEKSSLVNSTTTIQIKRSSLALLTPYRDFLSDNTWDEAIQRATNGEGEVFIDILFIDGEYAKSAPHEIFIQVGDNPPRYAKYQDGKLQAIEKLPKMEVKVKE